MEIAMAAFFFRRLSRRSTNREKSASRLSATTFANYASARRRLLFEPLEPRHVLAAPFAEFVDPHPTAGDGFGSDVVPLSSGNVVITAPLDDAGAQDAGAVYLFNGY